MHAPAQQPDAQLINFLRRLTSGFAAVVGVTGFLVLWGWAFEVSALKSLLPNFATMKPLTALSFLLAGVALWALRTEEAPNWQKRLGHLCAGVITVLGGTILLEYFFNITLGIDRWLFSQAVLAEGGLHPGRPSPTTAFSVFLLGWALLMLDKRPNWLATLLSLIVLFICGLAIVGYVYGVEDLYQIQPYSSMALHTALVFILSVFGCLFARPTQSVMGVIHSRFLGGQMARRLLPAAILLPLILGWLRLQGELAGWYDMRFGLALFASSNIVMFSALMLWNAQQLNQEDVQRTALHDSLRASEERFAKIFHSSPTAISIARIQSGEIIEANEACLQLLGYTRAEVIGRTAVELGITKAELRQQALQEINHLGILRNREGVIYTRTGEARNVIISLETSTLNGELCSLTSMFDITERKRAEAEIQLNQAKLEAGEALVNLGSWELAVGSQQGWWSKQMFRMTGFDPAQGVPSFEAYLNFVHPEDRDLILNALLQMSRGEQPAPQEFRSNPEHGPLRVFSPTYRVEYDAQGQPAKFIGTLLDITERKQAEMLITEALQEKEVLLKEIHHRVKNNLQVIASMLRLQVDGLTDPNARTLLIDNQRRVRSMALIHEQLYQAQDLAHINFNDYVTSLVNYLWRLYAPTQPQVEVQVRIEGVTLGTEQAMPLGLIVNELVSNSMRHAFPAGTDNGQQALWVSATHTAEGLLQVEVGDTGVGLPEGFEIEQTTSMGLQLVQAFVMQLRGQLLIQGHPGTLFKMIFPQVKEELWRKPD